MFDNAYAPGLPLGEEPAAFADVVGRSHSEGHRFSTTGSCIPPKLDEMPPGPALAAFLSAIDPSQLKGADRVVVLQAHQRMASHHQANAYAAMAAIRDSYTELRHSEGQEANSQFDAEDAAAEIRAALHLTRRSADVELTLALNLAERLPHVHAQLLAGAIDVRRARIIDDQTIDLSLATARALADRILSEAGFLTTGQLRSTLSRLRMDIQPDEAVLRYKTARDDRRVVVDPTPEGTAHLHAMHLPPPQAQAIMGSLTTIAKGLRRAADPRTIDQLRADVLVDMLTGGSSSAHSSDSRVSELSERAVVPGEASQSARNGRRGTIHLHVDLDTLAALVEHPGELNGYGPVIADVARQAALENPDSEWRFTVSDPANGASRSGTTMRRPTEAARRSATVENSTCVFPGCRMPARECDLDHIIAWEQGGPTEHGNLAPLCRFDHSVKHRAGWTYLKRGNGSVLWTTPLGLRHEAIDTDPWRPRPRPRDPPV